jgi:ATP-dependent helicase/nuclease subunit A
LRCFLKSQKNDPEAKSVLTNILHDYSHFNISTIDKFFQQAVRAFAREIGKNSSYSVELDQDMVLLQAIDQMILNLDKAENEPVLEWLLNLSYEKIEAGDNWDVKSGVFSTAKQLFREAYKLAVKESGDSITDKEAITDYNNILKEILGSYEDKMRGCAKNALSILKSSGLSADDFSYTKASFASRFAKIANGDFSLSSDRFYKACNDTSKWLSKDAVKNDPTLLARSEKAIELGLLDAMNSITELEEEKYTDYTTAQAIYPNLFTLGILSDIDKNIKDVSRENGIVLISETTELLNQIIDGSDTPFIYEKNGNQT